jgi:hypothetical protein
MHYCAYILNLIVKDALDELKFDFGCKPIVIMYKCHMTLNFFWNRLQRWIVLHISYLIIYVAKYNFFIIICYQKFKVIYLIDFLNLMSLSLGETSTRDY